MSNASSNARVTSVDGLRGLLATYVMVAHFGNANGTGALIPFANMCVMMFFIISGYVLTRSWTGLMPGFLVRRFLRLWPVYAICITVGGYMVMKPPALSMYVWFPFMGINDQAPQDPVTWSLFVEAWAMLFMPLIVWIGRRSWATAIAIPALVLVKYYGLAGYYSTDVYYGAFFIGGAYGANKTLTVSLFDTPVVQWLGRISYSLYLTHLLVIATCRFHFPALAFYIAIPSCFLVAHLTWLLVERPSIYLSRLFGRRVDALTAPLIERLRSGPAQADLGAAR